MFKRRKEMGVPEDKNPNRDEYGEPGGEILRLPGVNIDPRDGAIEGRDEPGDCEARSRAD